MINLKKSEWAILIGLLVLSFIPCIGGMFRLVELGLGTTVEFLPENPRASSVPLPIEIHIKNSFQNGCNHQKLPFSDVHQAF